MSVLIQKEGNQLKESKKYKSMSSLTTDQIGYLQYICLESIFSNNTNQTLESIIFTILI